MNSAESRPRSPDRTVALHWTLLATVYGALTAKAFLNFPVEWDFLAYHLPGALASVGLTTYRPEPRFAAMIAGFPPLPHLVAGTLVRLTGLLSAAGALNLTAFAGLVAGLRWLYGEALGLRWFLTALLGVPLFVFHLASGYVDLFTGCWLALALAALSELERPSSAGRAARPGGTVAVGSLLVFALGGAMLSKFQAWPIAGLTSLGALAQIAVLVREGRLRRAQALALGVALIAALGIWPLRDLLVYQNPTWPVQFPLAPRLFPNAAVEADSGLLNLPRWLDPIPRPAHLIASVTEISRLLPGGRYVWSLDQAAPGTPHHRMGGWSPITLVLLFLGARLSHRARLVPTSTVCAVAAAVMFVSTLPQGHELRYWFFVPLSLALWTARGLHEGGVASNRGLKAALVINALGVLWVTHPFEIDARPPAVHAPSDARAFWAAQRAHPSQTPVEICDQTPWAIFWAGPTFDEFPVQACYGWQKDLPASE